MVLHNYSDQNYKITSSITAETKFFSYYSPQNFTDISKFGLLPSRRKAYTETVPDLELRNFYA